MARGRAMVGLLHYIDARFASVEAEIATRARLLQEEIDRRLAETATATATAREEMNRRLEGMNEFRSAMSDLAARMLTKDEYRSSISAEKDRADIVHQAQGNRLDAAETRLDRLDGQASQRAETRLSVGQVMAIIGVVVTVVGVAAAIIIGTRP